jgi:hypothetical protein
MVVTAPDASGGCGTIEYTNPDCGGRMLACRVEGQFVHVRERYTHAESGCAPAGQLEFRCEGDRMDWAWVGWERAESVLTRAGAAPGDPRAQGSERPPQGPSRVPPAPTPTASEEDARTPGESAGAAPSTGQAPCRGDCSDTPAPTRDSSASDRTGLVRCSVARPQRPRRVTYVPLAIVLTAVLAQRTRARRRGPQRAAAMAAS